jgi:HK97 family phage portal protein
VRLFGLNIGIKKAAPVGSAAVSDSRGGWFRIFEPFMGAFQRDIEWTAETVLAHNAVYACITLIAADIGKMRPKLVQKDNGIWSEVETASPFWGVLRKPNSYQNHIQFKEWWMTSKLVRGNTYVLKERDRTGVVRALYILDPARVKVLVAPDGSVFYELNHDNLSGLRQAITVPASEIIHDRMNCLFHPLVGTSPIFACGSAANVGLKVANNSAKFFAAGSNPSGILSAPKEISQEDAQRLAEVWAANFTGDNSGKVAVLGNDMKFEPMRMTAVDSQLIQHLKWTEGVVCSTFHVPAFKAGYGATPTYQNSEVMNQIYYSDCLQAHIESMELVLDEGLGLTDVPGKTLGVELDIDTLIRMDTGAQVEALNKAVGGGWMSPNEARAKRDLKPVTGGDTPYMQQQNYSLAALDARDRAGPPGEKPVQPPPETDPDPDEPDGEEQDDTDADTERALSDIALKFSQSLRRAA